MKIEETTAPRFFRLDVSLEELYYIGWAIGQRSREEALKADVLKEGGPDLGQIMYDDIDDLLEGDLPL